MTDRQSDSFQLVSLRALRDSTIRVKAADKS